MESLFKVLTAVFLLGGSFFALTGAVGMIRMPDFYTRLHAAGKADTLAQTLIMIGLLLPVAFMEEIDLTSGLKLLVITLFLFVTAPTATHAITRAAHMDGAHPWREGSSDRE